MSTEEIAINRSALLTTELSRLKPVEPGLANSPRGGYTASKTGVVSLYNHPAVAVCNESAGTVQLGIFWLALPN